MELGSIASLTPVAPHAVVPAQVRPRIRELLGVASTPASPQYRVCSSETASDGVRIIRVEFPNIMGDPVPGAACVPVAAGSSGLPAVVCLPGTGSSADEMTDPDFHVDTENRNRLVGWARELSRRGFATMSITLWGCKCRRRSADEWAVVTKLAAPYGISPVGVMVDESIRAARVLQSVAGGEPGSLGVTGFSLGGQMAWWAAALEKWIDACAPLCGSLGSMDRAVKEGDPLRHGPHFYIPHLLRYFDHAEIVNACIVPRPLMILAPTRDEDMPASGVDRLLAGIRPSYERAGVPDALTVHRPDSRHVFRPEYFELMAAWFENLRARRDRQRECDGNHEGGGRNRTQKGADP